MSEKQAMALALRLSEFYEDNDPYNYADTLAEFDNNEDLLLEDIFNTLKNHPEVVIKELLDYIENYQED